MKLAVFSHKPCWSSEASPSGFATDGGFPAQMRALSELFDTTTLLVPCSPTGNRPGETPLSGRGLRVAPLTAPSAKQWARKAMFPLWLLRNAATIRREFSAADAVHTPIPGDIGTVGMLLAWAAGKPLFVRYCNNWFATRTIAERFWKWAMRRFAGGRNVMLATGGADSPPSKDNAAVGWIFASSLTQREIEMSARLREAPRREGPRLILVGRQEHGKGIGALVRSLPLIAQYAPGVCLELVGDGSARKEFETLAREIDVADRVTFCGNVSRAGVITRLQAADLFCFPTSAEGFPKAVLEALACGLPVLTTSVSVLPQLVAGCGRLLEEVTPQAVAEGVRWCLSDPERYRRMSAQALERARGYSLEGWRDRIGNLLRAAWGPLESSC